MLPPAVSRLQPPARTISAPHAGCRVLSPDAPTTPSALALPTSVLPPSRAPTTSLDDDLEAHSPHHAQPTSPLHTFALFPAYDTGVHYLLLPPAPGSCPPGLIANPGSPTPGCRHLHTHLLRQIRSNRRRRPKAERVSVAPGCLTDHNSSLAWHATFCAGAMPSGCRQPGNGSDAPTANGSPQWRANERVQQPFPTPEESHPVGGRFPPRLRR